MIKKPVKNTGNAPYGMLPRRKKTTNNDNIFIYQNNED